MPGVSGNFPPGPERHGPFSKQNRLPLLRKPGSLRNLSGGRSDIFDAVSTRALLRDTALRPIRQLALRGSSLESESKEAGRYSNEPSVVNLLDPEADMRGRNDDPANVVDPVYFSVGLARSRRAGSRPRTHAPRAAIELATGLADLLRQQPQ